MVESAVEASVTPGATREEIQSLVSKAVADSAAASLPGVTAAEVEKLVQEAVMGASESAAMAVSEAAAMAASKDIEAAAMERADGEAKVLNNDKMRQAFLHALDRQKLVDTFAQGNGLIYNSFLVHDWYQLSIWVETFYETYE